MAEKFVIVLMPSVAKDLRKLPAAQRQQILDTIEEQLSYEPTSPTRNKKILDGLQPPWEQEGPVWELRIGEYRAFYEVQNEQQTVNVRAVRFKPPHKSTKDIL